MSLVELDTAVRLGLGMIVIVYNDDAYGAEVNLFQPYTDKLDLVRFPETDIAAIARGYGCDGVTVRGIDDLDAVQTWIDGDVIVRSSSTRRSRSSHRGSWPAGDCRALRPESPFGSRTEPT